MTVVFIFKSGKVSKITVNQLQEESILQKIKSFFSQGYTDNDKLVVEDDGKYFFVDLNDVSAVEITKQSKRVKQ
jgi:sporulation protein YlmC with PRC-barrel domain